MAARILITRSLVTTGLFVVLMAIMFAIMWEGILVGPSMVGQWKAQGLTEAPPPWQTIIHIADFAFHKWFIAVPLCAAAAALIARVTVRDRSPIRG